MSALPLAEGWASWATGVPIAEVMDSPFLTCAGKCSYTTERVVRSVIARRCGEIGFKLYPYRCPRCGKIHITKHPPDVYRLRSQDSVKCATSATTASHKHERVVSTGHSNMHATIAAAGIASQVTGGSPAPRGHGARVASL